ncbi:ribonuclease T2 precursor [Azorhizobium caulinodans ORS 571]|uniref:Ribonuclease T2 n=1 Tax=Azorhizobium caulinodans (strain ATCC 43989 / DSM 5975 / JCM 20966 / LMG 6465 / NBRC 14845 / NCIMB 13405 / ORS 571) TaxID=438753 RepID=A8IBY9_AZOC5|nr:ribonuclease T2 [Azorhizobium caulinodans]BAF89136.1 ribonuclease T2 precursor [Azorhizobium caulinodans ORS 571]
MRLLAGLLLLLATATGAFAAEDRPGAFDFYVLSLSWSPSYCATRDRPDGLQCGGPRPFAFVVHGLWPQYEKGYPQDCDRSAPRLPQRQIDGMLDLMPSPGLVIHEWRKHGTCSGLSATAYFDLVRSARAKVEIPPSYVNPTDYRMVSPAEVETAFIAANPGLEANMLSVDCDKTRLREVRICLSKSLTFRPCPEVDAKSCPAGRRLAVPPLR